jgi:hypothetical protein
MITIFTTGPQCTRCTALKAAFQKAGLEFDEQPLDAAVIADVLCDMGEHITVAPIVKYGDRWVTDFFDAAGNILPDWLENMQGDKPAKAGFTGTGGKPQETLMDCEMIWR